MGRRGTGIGTPYWMAPEVTYLWLWLAFKSFQCLTYTEPMANLWITGFHCFIHTLAVVTSCYPGDCMWAATWIWLWPEGRCMVTGDHCHWNSWQHTTTIWRESHESSLQDCKVCILGSPWQPSIIHAGSKYWLCHACRMHFSFRFLQEQTSKSSEH